MDEHALGVLWVGAASGYSHLDFSYPVAEYCRQLTASEYPQEVAWYLRNPAA
jgi:hypothetical protein